MYQGYSKSYTFNTPAYSLIPGAQNLLVAPVTKTATNTMKIQYDFQIANINRPLRYQFM